MTNTNHSFDYELDAIWDPPCLKCRQFWHALYSHANKNYVRLNTGETNIQLINRVNPCITDEEAVIKKLLE